MQWGKKYTTKFYTGRLAHKVQPLLPYYKSFLTENATPLPTIEKRYPFHIPIKENCIPFLNLLMKLLMNDIMVEIAMDLFEILSLNDLLITRQMTDFPTLSYTTPREIPSLSYAQIGKRNLS